MTARLTQDIIDNVILKKNVRWKFQIKIWDYNDVLVLESSYSRFIRNYSINQNKSFLISSAKISLIHPVDNRFSPENPSAVIKIGYKIQIIEYYQDYPSIAFPRFYGIIRQLNPAQEASGNTIEVTAYDILVKAQDTDIDAEYESLDKLYVEGETLSPNLLSDGVRSQVFDMGFTGIASTPPPEVKLYKIEDDSIAIRESMSGYEFLYESGQVVLNSPIKTNSLFVTATYWYYRTGIQAEDIIKSILLTPDTYGNNIYLEANIKSTLFDEENSSVDNLIPITRPVNMTSILSRRIETTDTTMLIPYLDGWSISTNYSGTINGVDVSWTTRSLQTINGELFWEYNLTASPAQTINQGSKLSVFYEVNSSGHTRVWKTSYNNIITDVQSTDFTIPGAVLSGWDPRTGILITSAHIATTSNVTLNLSYEFYTLQSTGVEIPYLKVDRQTYKSRLDVIKNQVLALVPPNYVIFSRGEDKVWGMYLNQKTDGFEDYDLLLNKRVSFVTDQEVFTRVLLYGKNGNPNNLMLSNETSLPVNNECLIFSEAIDQELYFWNKYSGTYGAHYYKFAHKRYDSTYMSDINNMTIPSFWTSGNRVFQPIIKINGVPIGRELQRITNQECAVVPKIRGASNKLNLIIVEIDFGWAGSYHDETYGYKVKLLDSGIVPPKEDDPSTWIIFRNADAAIINDGVDFVFKKSDISRINEGFFDIYDSNNNYAGRIKNSGAESYWDDIPYSDSKIKSCRLSSYAIARTIQVDGEEAVLINRGTFHIHRNFIRIESVGLKDDTPDGIIDVLVGPDKKYYTTDKVTATFRYSTFSTAPDEIENLKDGDPESSTQFMFMNAPPLKGMPLFYIDFGEEKDIQAIDFIGGNFRPDIDVGNVFDCDCLLTIQYSNSISIAELAQDFDHTTSTQIYVGDGQLAGWPASGSAHIGNEVFTYTSITGNNVFNGVSGLTQDYESDSRYDPITGERSIIGYQILSDGWSNISRETTSFNLRTGDKVSFEEQTIGRDFSCRFLRVVVEDANKISVARDKYYWPVCIASLNIYSNVKFKADAFLTPVTYTTQSVEITDTVIHVTTTEDFLSSGTLFLGSDEVVYTGKTANTFTGCTHITKTHFTGSRVTQHDIWSDDALAIPDDNGLLKKYGDKVYKDGRIHEDLNTQTILNNRARNLLAEYSKNHSKIRVDNVFAPYVYVGQTLRMADSNGVERNYFVEAVSESNGSYVIDMAYYP